MTRLMFPYIGFISLVVAVGRRPQHLEALRGAGGDAGAAEPGHDRRGLAGSCRVFARWGIEPIYALAAGVMLGGVLQLGGADPGAARASACLPRIGARPARASRAAWRHPGVRRVLRQMAPALLGVSVAQISMLINTQIASHQGVGAVSWLDYADRLMEFPTALLGVALGVGADPAAVGGAGPRRRRRLLGHARLGPAPGAAAGAAVRGGAAGVSRSRWSRCCSSAARSTPWPSRKTALALRATASA